MPVRDVDPAELLLLTHRSGRLQPYVPREVDAELDRALASPGIVVIVSESFSGARRSAYEALLRNMPEALLASYDRGTLDDLHATVLWADLHHYEVPLGRGLDEMVAWQRGGARWVLILLGELEYTKTTYRDDGTCGAACGATARQGL